MKQFNRYLVVLVCLMSMLLLSCERDHLYYGNKDMAIVQLNIDWDSCHLSPNGATVLAYNADDGSLYRHFDPFSNPREAFVALPPGRYNLVIFNNTPAEYEGMIAFRNEEQWDTYEAYCSFDPSASTVSRPKRTNTDEQTSEEQEEEQADNAYYALASEPDTLAAAQVFDLEVTPDMITYYWDQPGSLTQLEGAQITQLEVVPHRVVSEATVQVHVEGLKYAIGKIHAYLRGLSAGYFMGIDAYSSEQVAHEFWLNNRQYDEGSSSDGTVSAKFFTFGACEGDDVHYYLDLIFTLVNGEEYPVTLDVSDEIRASINLNMTINMDIEVELPEAVGGGESGGFHTDLNEWEDIIQDIQM